ncbi:MAG: hypothetical protein RLP15_09460 [Cryomorphaceae bacterium]
MDSIAARLDRLWVGIVLGLIGPAFGFLFFYLFTSTHMPLENFVRFIQNSSHTHGSIISVSLIFNLVFFYAGTRFDMLRLAQGVIGGTLMYAPFVIYFKYVA